MRLYGIKTCDTCRAALKALEAAGHGPDFVDVRAAPLSEAELARFEAAFGEALINRRSTTWRGLSEDARAGSTVALLAAHPTLMKRPVIEADGVLYLSWGPEVRGALIP